MSTCRFCKGSDEHMMVKYEVRHYAHAKCGLEAKGVAFFAYLTDWQCYAQFPYMAAVDAGPEFVAELERRCELHVASEKARA
jgi:hypothetical protein